MKGYNSCYGKAEVITYQYIPLETMNIYDKAKTISNFYIFAYFFYCLEKTKLFCIKLFFHLKTQEELNIR